MITTKQIREKVPISKENILSRVKEEDLFKYYLKRDSSEKGLHTNPLRNDNHAGCAFFTSDQGRLLFQDFATAETYDIFRVVQEKYNLNFWEALVRINQDFKLRLGTKNPKKVTINIDRKKKEAKLIQVVPQPWNKDNLQYWNQFGITEEILTKFDVYAVDKVYVNKKMVARSTKKNPIYCYNFPFSNRVKIYRPLSPDKKKKWFSNTTSEDIFGSLQLPFLGETLIITSSLKDVMTLYLLGYTAIAPQAESVRFSKAYVDSLKSTFDEVIVFMDNDGKFNPPKGKSGKGKEQTMFHCKKYDTPFILIPDGEPKDISDYYKKYGKEATKKLMKSLLQKPQNYEDYVSDNR